jgi:S1-C subfamily serine protease
LPWPAAPARTARRRHRALGVLGAIAVLLLLAGTAIGIAFTDRTTSPSGFGGSSSFPTDEPAPAADEFGSSSATASLDIDVRGIADDVSPAIVNVAVTLTSGNRTAGSGMVITTSGLVLTNNHVINGAEKIEVEVGVTGDSFQAKVLGYDVADDVALLELEDASGLAAIKTESSSSVSRNDEIVAIGNALGRAGTPSAVAGTVTALNQAITAGEGLDRESLSGMIRVAASIQPGDSGGALVNADGRVIGMNTAADVGAGHFGAGTTTGFAIPIENALAIARQIQSGDSSSGVHIGARALLGVALSQAGDDLGGDTPFGADDRGQGLGARVSGVGDESPARTAGIEAGDTITTVNGRPIDSNRELRAVLDRYHPGDRVRIVWLDPEGDAHRATVKLIEGPPA